MHLLDLGCPAFKEPEQPEVAQGGDGFKDAAGAAVYSTLRLGHYPVQ